MDQACFPAENCTAGPTDGMRFKVMDLHDLPKASLDPFDLPLFKDIFYYLPLPDMQELAATAPGLLRVLRHLERTGIKRPVVAERR